MATTRKAICKVAGRQHSRAPCCERLLRERRQLCANAGATRGSLRHRERGYQAGGFIMALTRSPGALGARASGPLEAAQARAIGTTSCARRSSTLARISTRRAKPRRQRGWLASPSLCCAAPHLWRLLAEAECRAPALGASRCFHGSPKLPKIPAEAGKLFPMP